MQATFQQKDKCWWISHFVSMFKKIKAFIRSQNDWRQTCGFKSKLSFHLVPWIRQCAKYTSKQFLEQTEVTIIILWLTYYEGLLSWLTYQRLFLPSLFSSISDWVFAHTGISSCVTWSYVDCYKSKLIRKTSKIK